MAQRLIRMVERTAGVVRLRDSIPLACRESLTVGRSGDILAGVGPADACVSRRALVITAAHRGWRLRPEHRHGVELHIWGMPPRRIRHLERVFFEPRVAVRIVGGADTECWALLEGGGKRDTDFAGCVDAYTEIGDLPPPLTPREEAALREVFREFLAWPPELRPVPVPLKQVARKFGISTSAVRVRLDGARHKAEILGFPQPPSVIRPDVLHGLVQAGYLEFSEQHLDLSLRLSG
ncbi:hypothetical protein [Streptomyces silvensis]|uniref:hypothetical protein n=1 Tax=Streptomyces silvensis TaxID=1765722 RepID=UPI000A947BFC|nr:hypothetical protein [Streptomyces silvensis]